MSIFENALKFKEQDDKFSFKAQMKAAGVKKLNPCKLHYANTGSIVEAYLTKMGFKYNQNKSKQTYSVFSRAVNETHIGVGFLNDVYNQAVLLFRILEHSEKVIIRVGADAYAKEKDILKKTSILVNMDV